MYFACRIQVDRNDVSTAVQAYGDVRPQPGQQETYKRQSDDNQLSTNYNPPIPVESQQTLV